MCFDCIGGLKTNISEILSEISQTSDVTVCLCVCMCMCVRVRAPRRCLTCCTPQPFLLKCLAGRRRTPQHVWHVEGLAQPAGANGWSDVRVADPRANDPREDRDDSLDGSVRHQALSGGEPHCFCEAVAGVSGRCRTDIDRYDDELR